MKQKDFKQKVIKEFVKLKVFEILGIGYITVGTYYIGRFFQNKFPIIFPLIDNEPKWLTYWFAGFACNVMLAAVILLIIFWVMKNWQWARERVKER